MAREKIKVVNKGSFGGMFLVTYIGAVVYFLQQTHGFWATIGAFFEAMVWPGFVVYHALLLMHV